MSDYYVVPETKLNELKQAIQAKDGSTGQLEFPDGFISKIDSLTAGGYSPNDVAYRNYSGNIVLKGVKLVQKAFAGATKITNVSGTNMSQSNLFECFQGCTNLQSAYFPDLTCVGSNNQYVFDGCSNLTSVYLPKITSVYNYFFRNCTKLPVIVLPCLNSTNTGGFQGCSLLATLDIGGVAKSINGFDGSLFKNCTILTTLIIRYTSIPSLANVTAFDGTPFKSGGTGGTIYIPKSLYDKLGTGTSDYKAATNWSTIDARGTITWACIEGSQYETHYADGTEV